MRLGCLASATALTALTALCYAMQVSYRRAAETSTDLLEVGEGVPWKVGLETRLRQDEGLSSVFTRVPAAKKRPFDVADSKYVCDLGVRYI